VPCYRVQSISSGLAETWGHQPRNCIGVHVGDICPAELDAFLSAEFGKLLARHQPGIIITNRVLFRCAAGLLEIRLIQGDNYQEIIMLTELLDCQKKCCTKTINEG